VKYKQFQEAKLRALVGRDDAGRVGMNREGNQLVHAMPRNADQIADLTDGGSSKV
jgi:hypothetical protein